MLISPPSTPSFDPLNLLLGIIILLLISFLIREILCWYWKQNEIVELLKQIKNNTAPKDPPETTTHTTTSSKK